MTEQLGDILKKRSSKPKEPEEFQVIRKFVQDRYSITPKLSITKNSIQIGVPSSAIAGNLRFDLYDIQQKLDTKLRLIIKIKL